MNNSLPLFSVSVKLQHRARLAKSEQNLQSPLWTLKAGERIMPSRTKLEWSVVLKGHAGLTVTPIIESSFRCHSTPTAPRSSRHHPKLRYLLSADARNGSSSVCRTQNHATHLTAEPTRYQRVRGSSARPRRTGLCQLPRPRCDTFATQAFRHRHDVPRCRCPIAGALRRDPGRSASVAWHGVHARRRKVRTRDGMERPIGKPTELGAYLGHSSLRIESRAMRPLSRAAG